MAEVCGGRNQRAGEHRVIAPWNSHFGAAACTCRCCLGVLFAARMPCGRDGPGRGHSRSGPGTMLCRRHDNENDNDNDTQKSPNICRWRPGLTGKSVGIMTPRKKSVALMRLALLASCALKHCYGAMCSTSNLRGS